MIATFATYTVIMKKELTGSYTQLPPWRTALMLIFSCERLWVYSRCVFSPLSMDSRKSSIDRLKLSTSYESNYSWDFNPYLRASKVNRFLTYHALHNIDALAQVKYLWTD